MSGGFTTHPLWRKFQGRPIWVLSLSDTEHRLRDARALICLRDFLPHPKSGQCTYVWVTLDDNNRLLSQLPSGIPPNAGVVILGRPALFGSEVDELMKRCRPSLFYEFASDDPSNASKYRTILRHATVPSHASNDFVCPSFAEQRRANAKELQDYGIVASGWADNHPIMLLAGTSSVGTWGCVEYATRYPEPFDTCWQENIQGVIKASVTNTYQAFETVHVEVSEMNGIKLSHNSFFYI